MAAVEAARIATAIGVVSMFQQLGAGLGVAGFVAIVGTPARGAAIAAFRDGWQMMAVAAAAGSLLILAVRFAPTQPGPGPAPAEPAGPAGPAVAAGRSAVRY